MTASRLRFPHGKQSDTARFPHECPVHGLFSSHTTGDEGHHHGNHGPADLGPDIDATIADAHPAATGFDVLGADEEDEADVAAEVAEAARLVEVATPSAPLPQPANTATTPNTPTVTP